MTGGPIKFDGTISFGHIVLIVTLFASAIAAWIANRERTFDNAAAIEQLVTSVRDLDLRVRKLEYVERNKP